MKSCNQVSIGVPAEGLLSFYWDDACFLSLRDQRWGPPPQSVKIESGPCGSLMLNERLAIVDGYNVPSRSLPGRNDELYTKSQLR